jgi:hypothetical protein
VQTRLPELVLEALPAPQIYTADGGHEWATWAPLGA